MAKRRPRDTWEALGRPPWWTWPLLLVPLGSVTFFMAAGLCLFGVIIAVAENYAVGALFVFLGLAVCAVAIWQQLHDDDLP